MIVSLCSIKQASNETIIIQLTLILAKYVMSLIPDNEKHIQIICCLLKTLLSRVIHQRHAHRHSLLRQFEIRGI